MINLVHNERIKHAAAFLNNLAVVAMATGVFAPLIPKGPELTLLSLFSAIAGFAGGVILLYGCQGFLAS